ncbi:SDR family oxidoreductase [Acetobacteraceae bacterium H6797]|nr:SDR family oxidoreductase [Acetobacteraceae bacterium H6797]
MDLGLAGRRAIVCGGSRGMGRATALMLAKEGVDVLIVARNPATLAEAADAIGAEAGRPVAWLSTDLTSEAGRAKVFEACAEPDILINNGDGMPPGDFREWTDADWHRAIDMMMLAPIGMIRLCVDGMMARGFGRIVNIVSRSVKIPQLEMGMSNGARSGLVGFVAGLARQTVAKGVTVNNVLPGIIDTDAQRHHILGMLEMTGKSFEQLWAEREAANPAKRYGRAEEVAAAIAYFCSVNAGFVTGQNLLVDGGQYPGTY